MTVSEYLGIDEWRHRYAGFRERHVEPVRKEIMQRWQDWAIASLTTALLTICAFWFSFASDAPSRAEFRENDRRIARQEVAVESHSQRIVALERSVGEIKADNRATLEDIKTLIRGMDRR